MKKLNAAAVSRLLKAGSLPSDDIAEALGVARARDRRDLRRLLSGMLRSGELSRDHQGGYHLAETESRIGYLERSGRNLTFAGLPIERGKRSWLRPGDKVEASVSGEDVRILRVLARAEEPLLGILQTHTRYPYVDSLSPDYKGRISLLEIPADAVEGDTVAVRITDEDRRGLVGVVTSTLARGGGAGQAAETMLANFAVPLEWPEGVEAALAKLPSRVNAGGHHDRRSLVDMPLVTIDGESARDFDDAVFAEKRRGGWHLVVAIADVSHYVKAGSALDAAAWERATSVYLPDRVVPMLPEQISNELCSLKPHVPRLAMVCDMKVSNAGRVTSFEFYNAVIRSAERLTYTRVQEFLDTGAIDVTLEIQASLRALEGVYRSFRRAREERGGLDFDTHESRLELDENGHVAAIHPELRVEANRLIEEAMIAANVCAAEFLEKAGASCLYRIHEPPKADRLETLRQAFAVAGVRLSSAEVTPRGVCAALEALGDVPNRWLFEFQVLRSLSQAVYSPENKGHFGLALSHYMHFTSPIRRYPDLLVHRAIKSVLAGSGPAFSMDYLESAGVHTSMAERRADEVSWGVDAWLKCEYVAQRRGETFAGVVMGVAEFGLFVELTGFYVQGLVHISELGQDYFQYRPQSQSLVGERSGRRFSLGDPVDVVLEAANPEQGKLDLRLVNARKGNQQKKSGAPSRGTKTKGTQQSGTQKRGVRKKR
jgi:ribonuclease R